MKRVFPRQKAKVRVVLYCRQVGSGPKFDYNYFHSQLRIKIESAFGMLVNRWGILRRDLPAGFGIWKSNSLMRCLCRLHNYCIDHNSARVEKLLCADLVEIRSAGGISLDTSEDNMEVPRALLGGGEHFDDVLPEDRRQFARRGLGRNGRTPRDLMLKHVADGGFVRPTPKHWD